MIVDVVGGEPVFHAQTVESALMRLSQEVSLSTIHSELVQTVSVSVLKWNLMKIY